MPRRLLLTLLVLCTALPARADMPAREILYADVEGLRGAAAESLGEHAAALSAWLATAGDESCMPMPEAPRHRCLGDHGLFHAALIDALRPALRAGGRPRVEAFLERASRERLLRGQLVARNGGSHETTLALGVDPTSGRPVLITRHLFADGRVGVWRRPFSLCADLPVLTRGRDPAVLLPSPLHRWIVETDAAGLHRLDRAAICDERTGAWVDDGPWIAWHANGARAVQGFYRLGQRVGEWRRWDQWGRELERVEYRRGVPMPARP